MQEFTEKDCMQTEKEASIQNRVVVLPSKVLPEHYTGQLFSVRISRKQKIPDIPLPIWFLYLLGRHGTAGTGMWLVCCGQNCWGKRNGSSSPRSVHLGRWIYMDIPQNILDTVFCRMDAMRQGYGWQIQRKYGAM